jgi:fucose permease
MIALAVLAGLGAGAIDAGLNAWAAEYHSARTMNWLHACYGLGTMLGPIVMSQVLLAGRPWRLGYALAAGAQLLLAASFVASRRRWPAAHQSRDGAPRAALGETLGLGGARLSGLSFFLYAAIEAVAGAWTYSLLHEARGVATGPAARGVSLFWGGLMAGRIAAGLLPPSLPPARLVRASALGIAAGTALLLVAWSSAVALLGLALLGVSAGPVFPTLVAATPGRLGGGHAANAVGLQVAAAALGLSLAPAAVGLLAQRSSLEVVPWTLGACALALLVASESLERRAPAPVAGGGRAPRA